MKIRVALFTEVLDGGKRNKNMVDTVNGKAMDQKYLGSSTSQLQ